MNALLFCFKEKEQLERIKTKRIKKYHINTFFLRNLLKYFTLEFEQT